RGRQLPDAAGRQLNSSLTLLATPEITCTAIARKTSRMISANTTPPRLEPDDEPFCPPFDRFAICSRRCLSASRQLSTSWPEPLSACRIRFAAEPRSGAATIPGGGPVVATPGGGGNATGGPEGASSAASTASIRARDRSGSGSTGSATGTAGSSYVSCCTFPTASATVTKPASASG